MLRIIAIDDEQLILDHISYIFSQFDEAELVATFLDPHQALEQYGALCPDAVLIDINMPKINGLDFAERIKAMDPAVNILFLTAYDDYAIDAFGVGAVDYLLKPVTASKLKKSLQRIQSKLYAPVKSAVTTAGLTKIPVLINNHIQLIDPATALFITVSSRHVYCVTENGKYELRHPISYWEEQLADQGWFRCHRCFLINLNKVSEVSLMFNNTYDVRMMNHTESIPISRTYAKAFREHFGL